MKVLTVPLKDGRENVKKMASLATFARKKLMLNLLLQKNLKVKPQESVQEKVKEEQVDYYLLFYLKNFVEFWEVL